MKQGMTLAALAAELERQEAAKADYVADTRRMHFVTRIETEPSAQRAHYTRSAIAISEIDLLGEGANEGTNGLVVLDRCHDQLAGHLGIPKRYYDRLRGELPVLLDENVNRLLHHSPERRMLRTLDGKARAFLSDRYRRLDNGPLAATLLPILGDIPEVRIESCAVTDERMYIKAITPRVTGQVKVGEEVCAGVFISNSEVGSGSLRVEPFVYTLACTNGMVIPRSLGAAAMRRVHVGRRVENDEESYRVFSDATLQADDRAFFLACADVVRAAVDEVRFRELVEVMKNAAASIPMANVAVGVERLAKAESLSDTEEAGVLTHLAAGGDLSQWGLLSAVTRAAEDADSYDRATELEELGGKLLTFNAAEWERLAVA